MFDGDVRSRRRRILGTLGALLAFFVCGTQAAAQGRDATNGKEDVTIVVFLIDPTVLDEQSAATWRETMKGFSAFFSTLRQKTDAVLFVVEKEMMQRAPADVCALPLQLGGKGALPADAHKAELAGCLAKWQKIIDGKWKEYHQPQRSRQPTSCLLSALHRAGKYVEAKAPPKGTKSRVEYLLVVVSDLMEVCDEVGRISLEDGKDELKKLQPPLMSPLPLKRFDGALLMQLPNKVLTTPVEDGELLKTWRALLERSGVEKIAIDAGFPQATLEDLLDTSGARAAER